MFAKLIRPVSGSTICSITYWDEAESFTSRFDTKILEFLDPFPEEFKRQATLFIMLQLSFDLDFIDKWKKENLDPTVKDMNLTGFTIVKKNIGLK